MPNYTPDSTLYYDYIAQCWVDSEGYVIECEHDNFTENCTSCIWGGHKVDDVYMDEPGADDFA